MIITKPGLYDLPAAVYHSDPTEHGSLSQSRAKVLLDEGGPALFKLAESQPRDLKPAFDIGTAAHALILGKGSEQLAVVDADSWRTKAAQAARAEAYAAGQTPLLTKEMAAVQELADSLNPELADLFTGGKPEVAMFWPHESGQWLRGQIDYLRDDMIIDLKTMRDVSTRGFDRAVWDHRYYLQAAWYRQGLAELTGETLPYIIVGIDKTTGLSQARVMSEEYLTLGEAHMDRAINIYLECVAANHWPGMPVNGAPLNPPSWAATDLAAAALTELEALLGETP